MFKKCKVVMLPNNEKATRKSDLAINENNLLFQPSKLEGTWFFLNKFQHLYILSDDEIKEGDSHITSDHEGYGDKKYKIIATTDTSLQWLDESEKNPELARPNGLWKCLPQPSQSFIQKYVDEYNKGNIITEVMVEYEINDGYMEVKSYLKVSPKDNTITIKKVKDSWNREELTEILSKFREDLINCIGHKGLIGHHKWIEENL